jgi:hypothetical protein
VRALLIVVAAVALVGCGSAKSGEDCTGSCSGGLSCIQVFNSPDGGCSAPTSSSCEHLCTSDSDCKGTSGVFGDTPACGSDCHGNRFCVPSF